MKNGNNLIYPNITTIAVVPPDDVTPLKQMVEKEKDKKGFKSNVIVTVPEQLQCKLDAVAKAFVKNGGKNGELYILVSSAIRTVAYHISSAIRKATVGPCAGGGQGELRIDSRSTYCNSRTYAWDNRPESIRKHNRNITHMPGCYWNLEDVTQEAKGLLRQSFIRTPDIEESKLNEVKAGVAEMRDKNMPSQDTPGWLERWRAIVTIAFGAIGGGAAGFYGFCAYSSSGILLTGPAGLSISIGHKNFLAGGGGMATFGTAIAAGALAYFIPWDKVFAFLREAFKKVWEAVRDVIAWVWDKIKSLPASLMSFFT